MSNSQVSPRGSSQGSGEGPLLTLPPELIRKIGDNIFWPRDLLSFACTCQQVHAVVDATEYYRKDVILHRALLGQRNEGIVQYPYPNRGILWAIQNDVDIDYIGLYINMWMAEFPIGLRYQMDCGDDTPMRVARACGRADVVCALISVGIPVWDPYVPFDAFATSPNFESTASLGWGTPDDDTSSWGRRP
ncbi:hypothetical protein F5Y04DRAFT_284191 [Hypomontagnella monticulosa]|nr:hypothetical protein F5Y04DRAFT_284191 [Hypomontagnella monticulosa]